MAGAVPLDVSGYRPAVLADQAQPMLIWVKVADLVVNRAYQRQVNDYGRRAIQRIADGFDWKKYEPILVAPADGGTFAVVDGQHRAHAAAVCGIEEIPAMCVPMTLAEQAQGFAAINRDRIRITLTQIYRADLAAGADWALACREAVEAAGCTLATFNPTATAKMPRVVYGIGLIRRMVDAGEGEAVTAGLRGIAGSAQGGQVACYGGPVLGIWLPALARNQRFLRMDLSRAFDGVSIEEIRDGARDQVRRSGGSAKARAIDMMQAHLAQALQWEAAA